MSDVDANKVPRNTMENEDLTQLLALKGNFISGVQNGTGNTESAFAHGLGKIPRGYIIIDKDRAGDIYTSKAASDTYIYLKCTVVSVVFKAYVF